MPLVGGRLELADEGVGGPGVGQQGERGLGLAAHHHVRSGSQQGRDLADHDGRLLARSAQRRRGHHRGRHQGHATSDQASVQRISASPGAGTSAVTMIDCTAAWVTSS